MLSLKQGPYQSPRSSTQNYPHDPLLEVIQITFETKREFVARLVDGNFGGKAYFARRIPCRSDLDGRSPLQRLDAANAGIVFAAINESK